MKMNTKQISLGGLFVLVIAVALISAFNTSDYRKASDEDIKAAMIADWQWAKGYTLSYIEAMPESGINYRPTDSVRSFAEQMLHITSADVGFTAQVTGVPPTIEDVRGLEQNESYKNKAALTAVVTQGYDFVITSLEAMPADQLGDQIKLFGQYDLTKAEAMHKAFIHQNHHRGQTAVYIRLAGGTPAAMELL